MSVRDIAYLAEKASRGCGQLIIYGAGLISTRDLAFIAEKGQSAVKFENM
jgi:hypothetical protein